MGILDHALACAGRGWRVFPLSKGSKIPPKGMKWRDEASCDQEKIRGWWRFNPDYNYAVATGDGLIVVDIDAGRDGFVSAFDLDFPPTFTVSTPGGGVHMYYAGAEVSSSVDRVASGIDIRSEGGYVVGPGSYFSDATGEKGYTGSYVVTSERDAEPAPQWLVLTCGRPSRRERERTALSTDSPEDIIFAIHYLQKDAPIAVSGRGGNNTTYAVAARLIEMGLSEETATALLHEYWNERCDPPWDDLAPIVHNAARYSQKQPGAGSAANLAAEWQSSFTLERTAPSPVKPQSSEGKFNSIFERRTRTPLELIPARRWVMHRLLLRDEVTVMAGPGGVGKSGFSLALAAHGAAGRSLAGYTVKAPFKTVIYNLEDSRHEMEARLYAACAMYDLDPDVVWQNVLLWPGREQRFRLIGKDHVFAMADIKEVARLLRQGGFDALILDPLISLHHEEENDNSAMGEVMEALHGLSRIANVATLALHHTPKSVRQAGSSDAVRGAGNIVNAVRIAHTIYAADEADATLYGLGEGYRGRFIRVDDAKQNMAELGHKPLWMEKCSFPLPSGDTSYSMRVVETGVTQGQEAQRIANILAYYMQEHGTLYLQTYDAARTIASEDAYFREQLPASKNYTALKTLVESRLANPLEVAGLGRISVVSKTDPGASASKLYVEFQPFRSGS